MPGGVALGGAYFELYGDNQQLMQSMAQARVAVATATKAMADAQTAYANAAKSSNAQIAAGYNAVGDQFAATAAVYGSSAKAMIQQINALKEAANKANPALQNLGKGGAGASGGFLAAAKSSLGFATSLVGVQTAAQAAEKAITGLASATQDLNQNQFRLNKLYGDMAPLIAEQALAIGKAAGRSRADSLEMAGDFASISKNFALSNDQVVTLMKVAADAAAVQGMTLSQAAERVEAALRGETEASEKLGFSLQSNYLKALQQADSAERKHFETLGPATKAQIVYNEIIKQRSQYEGAAAERAATAAGAYDLMTAAITDLAATIGTQMNPQFIAFADLVVKSAQAAERLVIWLGALYKVGNALGQQMGMPPWLAALLSPQLAAATAIAGQLSDEVANLIKQAEEASRAAVTADQAAKAAAATRAKDAKDAATLAREAAELRAKQIAELEKKARDKAIEEENRAYAAKRAQYEADKQAAIKAAEVKRDAAIKAIEAEQHAVEQAYDAMKAALENQRDEKLLAVAKQKEASLRALEAEGKAVADAAEETIRQAGIARDGANRATEARKDAALRALDLEIRAREHARTEEDRALEDSVEHAKRSEEKRHQSVLAGLEKRERAIKAGEQRRQRALEDEGKAIDARHRSEVAGIDAAAKAAEKAHDAAMRAISVEQDAAEKQHTAEVRAIKAEEDAAEKKHAAIVRSLKDQEDAAEKAHAVLVRSLKDEEDAAQRVHDTLVRSLRDQEQAAQRAHDVTRRALDDELDAAKRVHEQRKRALDDELDAAKAVHTATRRALDDQLNAAERLHDTQRQQADDQLDAAKELHDAQRAGLESMKRIEDARHRQVLADIEEEKRSKLAFFDASLDALDAEQEAEETRLKLLDLQSELEEARSSGNAAAIARVERQILKTTADHERDLRRAQIKGAKDAASAAIDAAKDAADAEHDRVQQAIKDQEDLYDAQLDATKKIVDARKAAADAAFKLIKDQVEAARQAADDEYALVQASVAARKQAADDEYAAIQASVEARRLAADDELLRIKTILDARILAADDELLRIKTILDAKKVAADDELLKLKESLDAQRVAADDQLVIIKELLDARKLAADDELVKIKDALAQKKLALDDEKAKNTEMFAAQRAQADERARHDKELLDDRKRAVDDETSHALDKLRDRREKEEKAHKARQQEAEDGLKEAKRRIEDERKAEDEAAQDRRYEIGVTAEAEKEATRQIYDDEVTGIIPATKRALDAYNDTLAQRKTLVEDWASDEIQHIHDVYDDPENGLLAQLKRAYDDTVYWYGQRKDAVNEAYQAEKDAIEDTYSHPVHGLFAQLERIHQATLDGLKDTEQDWRSGFQEPITKVVTETVDDAINQINRLISKQRQASRGGGGGDDDDDDGGGGGGLAYPIGSFTPGLPVGARPGAPVGGVVGGEYRPVVENAAADSYWTSGGTHGGHPAADIFAPLGSAIFAPIGGTMSTGSASLGGNFGVLEGDNGRAYYFAHAQGKMTGGRVESGQTVGRVGDTGNARGGRPHLHFAIASDSGLFDAWNGSGDITGDASYWQGSGGGGARIPEAPGLGRPGNPHASHDQIKKYIELSAQARQIDPDIAWRAAMTEGKDPYSGMMIPMAVGKFDTGWSYWPFQLHYAARGRPGVTRPTPGLGDESGIEEARAENWTTSTDYALDVVRKEGWNKWYGPAQIGITGFKGVLRGYAQGGYIPEPTLLVGQTLGPYAVAGEVHPEWVTPGLPGGIMSGPKDRVEMPIYLGNREIERLWIDGYHLNVQRGRVLASGKYSVGGAR